MMKKNISACIRGDCPALDGGPESTEHDGRFLNWSAAQVNCMKNDSGINGDSLGSRKREKNGATTT